jgi:hypothetical protein
MDRDLDIQHEKGGKKAGTRLERAAEEYLSQTQVDLGDLTEAQKKVVLGFVKRKQKAEESCTWICQKKTKSRFSCADYDGPSCCHMRDLFLCCLQFCRNRPVVGHS